MKLSWKIGNIGGIALKMHATFPLLLVWVIISALDRSEGWKGVWDSTALIFAIFSVVVLHELGHAWAARKFRIRTRDITLLPFGGFARLQRMPRRPREEAAIAVAGPAVNVGIGIIAFAALMLVGNAEDLLRETWIEQHWVGRLFWTNAFLAGFNLLPVFPLDGGRILRAMLASRLKYSRATELAAAVGQTGAIGLGAAGLALDQPLMAIIAAYLWFAGGAELNSTRVYDALTGVSVKEIMQSQVKTLDPDSPISEAVRTTLETGQRDFPVVSDGKLVGFVRRTDLVEALSARGPEAPTREAMTTHFRRLLPSADAKTLLDDSRLQPLIAPVVNESGVVGIITPENLAEFVLLRTAANRVPLSGTLWRQA
jgi:Zn-dependent protease/CBS domain-containing protein